MNHSQVQEAFKNFDANGDGKITEEGILVYFSKLFFNWITLKWLFKFKEYISACRKNGNNASEASLKDAFKIFDVDSDGNIDFGEFYSALKFLGQISDWKINPLFFL